MVRLGLARRFKAWLTKSPFGYWCMHMCSGFRLVLLLSAFLLFSGCLGEHFESKLPATELMVLGPREGINVTSCVAGYLRGQLAIGVSYERMNIKAAQLSCEELRRRVERNYRIHGEVSFH